MCRSNPCMHPSTEEATTAEDSLLIYCKPVELYNILHHRALRNPSFLQRCLSYKIQARRKKSYWIGLKRPAGSKPITKPIMKPINRRNGALKRGALNCYWIGLKRPAGSKPITKPIMKPINRRNGALKRGALNWLQMSLSFLSTVTEREQAPHMFPLYILLAKPICGTAPERNTAVYHLIRSCSLSAFTEIEGKSRAAEANLLLPEINKLSLDAKAGKISILLVSFGKTESALRKADPKGKFGGYCMLGKVPIASLCTSLEMNVNLTWGQRVEMLSKVDMQSCLLQPCGFEKGEFLAFESRNYRTEVAQQQIQVSVAVKLAQEIEKSPYDSFTCTTVPESLSNIFRLRAGNVIFNYRDLNNLLKNTEVTEDFSCPFCLVQCASFKGLQCHLISSHDLFNFEFWVTEEYQAVDVSVRVDIIKSETVADVVDPKNVTFLFCSKSRKGRRQKDHVQKSPHMYPFCWSLAFPKTTREGTCDDREKNDGKKGHKSLSKKDLDGRRQAHYSIAATDATDCLECVASSFNNMTVSVSMPEQSANLEYVPSSSGSDPIAFDIRAKSRKMSMERSDSKSRFLLHKREFFHSHRAQPMALDQVLSENDSEDEVDNDVADIEDRRMLDDFVDVTEDEKYLMHLWNSFMRKQRVLADGHVPWACEAFSKLHAQELVRVAPLFWCWRLFMIKLWNHGLLDARTMDICNTIIEESQT